MYLGDVSGSVVDESITVVVDGTSVVPGVLFWITFLIIVSSLCFEGVSVFVTFLRNTVFVGPSGLPDVFECSVSRIFVKTVLLFLVFDGASLDIDAACLATV